MMKGANTELKDDFRQFWVIVTSEYKRHARADRFKIFFALIGFTFVFITVMPFIIGTRPGNDPEGTMYLYTTLLWILIAVATSLFTSTSISSEFEHKTALLILTKPIRRSTIVLGKGFASSSILTFGLIVYYTGIAAVSYAMHGAVSDMLLPSFICAFAYLLGCCGFCIFISANMNKGSSATVVSMIILIVILPLIYSTVTAFVPDVDLWFIMTGNGISTNDYSTPVSSSWGLYAISDAIWYTLGMIAAAFVFNKREY